MNCPKVREELASFLYGELGAEAAKQVEEHLAGCDGCRLELAALKRVRRLLDAAPALDVQVDVPGIYRRAADRQWRSARLWRRTAALLAMATAALIVVAVWTRLEILVQPHQLVLRWAPDAARQAAPEPAAESIGGGTHPARSEATSSPAIEEQLRVISDVVRALAADVDAREAHHEQALARLADMVQELRRQSNVHWTAAQRDVAALYAAQFTLKQGDLQ